MPMTKDDLWRRYTERYPEWLTRGANLTPAGIRKLFDQTFDAGHTLGLANGRALAEMERAPAGGGSAFDGLANLFKRR